MLLQGVDSVWETDLLQPLVDKASELTGRPYTPGDYDDRDSFAISVLAEHARSTAMLVADGVFPSNEARGYVLRRIIRRAVRYAYLLGTEHLVLPELAEVAVDVDGQRVSRRRPPAGLHRQRARQGRGELPPHAAQRPLDPREGAGGPGDDGTAVQELSGSTAFVLHDTYGFPLELTQEIAQERGVTIDIAGFESEMAEQRTRAKAARGHAPRGRQRRRRTARIVEEHGTTTFTGLHRRQRHRPVLDVLAVERARDAVRRRPRRRRR